MRKRRPIVIRTPEPDYKYNSVLIAKFACQIMLNGKKTTAFRLIYKFLDKVIFFLATNQKEEIFYLNENDEIIKLENPEQKEKLVMLSKHDICWKRENELEKINPEKYFSEILEKLFLTHCIRTRKIGGATYQVPYPATPRDKIFKTMKLFRNICRKINRKSGMSFDDAMFLEFKNIYMNTGESIKYIEQRKKTISANLAFANMFGQKRKFKK